MTEQAFLDAMRALADEVGANIRDCDDVTRLLDRLLGREEAS